MWKSPSWSTATRMRRLVKVCPPWSTLHTHQLQSRHAHKQRPQFNVQPSSAAHKLCSMCQHPEHVHHHVEDMSVQSNRDDMTKLGVNQPNQGCLHDTSGSEKCGKKANTHTLISGYLLFNSEKRVLMNTVVNQHVLKSTSLGRRQS